MKKQIHRGYDFTQLGGFPLNQQRLEYMQTAYAELSGGLAGLFGDNVIVSGCVVSGNTVTDGWIVVNGVLYPFLGTTTGALDTFLIREARNPLTFKDGSEKEVQFNLYAQFGTSDGAIQWSSLKRLPSLLAVKNHMEATNNPHSVTKAQVGLGNIPNAKTDDPNVSDSDILATSAAVNAINGRIVARGSVTLDKSVNLYEEILLDNTDTKEHENWLVLVKISSVFINAVVFRDDWLSEVRISTLNRRRKLQVYYFNDQMGTQDVRLNYVVIKTK
ncbi:MAG: hypothetical protein E6767_20685 [Dysgonomonas sp.]|nr:hypothetical protein [Dysgonomonas sp.]